MRCSVGSEIPSLASATSRRLLPLAVRNLVSRRPRARRTNRCPVTGTPAPLPARRDTWREIPTRYGTAKEALPTVARRARMVVFCAEVPGQGRTIRSETNISGVDRLSIGCLQHPGPQGVGDGVGPVAQLQPGDRAVDDVLDRALRVVE